MLSCMMDHFGCTTEFAACEADPSGECIATWFELEFDLYWPSYEPGLDEDADARSAVPCMNNPLCAATLACAVSEPDFYDIDVCGLACEQDPTCMSLLDMDDLDDSIADELMDDHDDSAILAVFRQMAQRCASNAACSQSLRCAMGALGCTEQFAACEADSSGECFEAGFELDVYWETPGQNIMPGQNITCLNNPLCVATLTCASPCFAAYLSCMVDSTCFAQVADAAAYSSASAFVACQNNALCREAFVACDLGDPMVLEFGSNFSWCTDADLATRSKDLTTICCDEATQDCDGMPTTCNAGCAGALYAYFVDCGGTILDEQGLYQVWRNATSLCQQNMASSAAYKCTCTTDWTGSRCQDDYHNTLRFDNPFSFGFR
jgi:hypothetical protein